MPRGRRADPTRVKEYDLPFHPLLLKELVLDCDISQGEFADFAGVSRPAINLCLNRGNFPKRKPDFRTDVEAFVRSKPQAMQWLLQSGLNVSDIWKPAGRDMRQGNPSGHGRRVLAGMNRPGLVLGNPEEIISTVEVEMLDQNTRKHFKLFRDPFPANGGVEKDADIFMSDEHRYIEAAMLDAAKHSGLIAIISQVGGGKSTIRKRVFEQIRREGGILTVFPQILDKDKINSGTLCDAIIMDVSDQKPKSRHEHKARQVKELLKDRSRNGDRCCLVIEEAHKLTVNAFITLKQLWELEDGYNKLISIIIIGQTELDNKLDERHHPEMREFIRRCQIARINGLNGDMGKYLEFKFKRVGVKIEDVFEPEAIEALSRRLSDKDERGKKISHAYPLTVNLYAVRAMNLACEMKYDKVTAEVVEAI